MATITGSGSIPGIRRCSTTSTTVDSTGPLMPGKSWRFAVSAGGSQFYNVALDTSSPAWAYGSIQDVGSRRGRVDITKGRDRIPAVDWTEAPGGEGSNQAIDPQNPNIVYSHGFYGNFTREDLGVSRAPVAGCPAGRRRGRRAAPGRDSHPPAARTRQPGASRAVDGPHPRVSARSGDDLRRLSVRLAVDQSWRRVAGDQQGSERERSRADAAQKLERDPLPDGRLARGVAENARG